ncbi:hypothetical protein RRG08_009760 [Elysia crispata]|uniref:Uncharacterized protein n=1 Tax=Elysia crispata TaxID=231223 RepID=A0AAE0YYE9_9GAST|nr:hypothetical protein RRG08_009760 [Elysia crispata]
MVVLHHAVRVSLKPASGRLLSGSAPVTISSVCYYLLLWVDLLSLRCCQCRCSRSRWFASGIPTDSTCRFQSAPPPSCLLWTECKLRCSVFGASEPPKQASFSASLSHNNKYAMAEGVPVLSARMRENLFIGENGTDSLETESQGSRDEIIERDPGCVEDRFRVDRKKLEQMLQLVIYALQRGHCSQPGVVSIICKVVEMDSVLPHGLPYLVKHLAVAQPPAGSACHTQFTGELWARVPQAGLSCLIALD